MAEGGRSRENLLGEGLERQCPLCPKAYQRSRGVKVHLNDKHRDHPDYAAALSRVPKSPSRRCRYCDKGYKNPRQHEGTCPENPLSTRALKKDNFPACGKPDSAAVPEPDVPNFEECVVCFLPMEHRVVVLPCGHARFCQECIDNIKAKAGRKALKCPMCNKEFAHSTRVFI